MRIQPFIATAFLVCTALPVYGQQAFVYSGGVYTTIVPPAPTAFGTIAWGNNNLGDIVGSYAKFVGPNHTQVDSGYIYSHGVFTDIVVPSATSNTTALGINDFGQVVGAYNGGTRGFLYSGGVYTDLSIAGLKINDFGQIVGYIPNSPTNTGALYSNGVYTPLSFPGATFTLPSDINNFGNIVGTYVVQGPAVVTSYGAFLYSHGLYTTIHVPGSVSTYVGGINDFGDIVGSFNDSSGIHPFVYHDGFFTTLDDPLLANFAYGEDINDWGQIVGQYYDLTHLPPITSVPEPSTWALLVIGFAGIGAIIYRRRNIPLRTLYQCVNDPAICTSS